MKILSLLRISFWVIIISVFFSGMTFAQWDNPNLDRIPERFIKQISPKLYEPMVVVTLNDYDNFNMGTDFAEGHVSMNPMNPLQIFCAFNTNGTHYTMDGGLTWATVNPSFPNTAGDPVTAYDSLGNLFYECLNSGITACWVAKSTTNGSSWVWANVSATTGNDKNWIAADQTGGPYSNYLYTVMTNGSAAQFARSTNNGASFTNTASLTPHNYPGAMVCVGPNGSIQGGSVYVVTHSGPNSAGVYGFFVSTDAGLTFTAKGTYQWPNYIGTEISSRSTVSGMRCRPYPFIAADNSYGPYRGRLYCVYASNNPSGNGNKSDIFLRWSSNQGTNWSNAVVVNDDPNSASNYQFHPAIWCDKTNGKLYVMFYDTRNCATSDSMDVYATYSTDGGQTFAPNQRVTNQLFKIKLSSSGSAPAYQGDYNSIVSNPKTSMLVWGDFRNNGYGSFSGYFPDYAMRMNPTSSGINSVNGVKDFNMVVPSVKLYTDTVIVSAVITPTPGSGSFAITYPSPGANKLAHFPDSLSVRVTANNVTPGTYTMTVTAKGPNGTPVHQRAVTITASTTSGVIENNGPSTFSLSQNYPNPFNPFTRIDYSIAKASDVKISIYNILGKEITSYAIPNQNPGNHYIMFNASNLSTGVYYYTIKAGDFTDKKTMILMK
ncbi:MAG: T9SS type A sorting domain-containing protein [Bacteroidetes bacterium]|nr:T9SS type A sorting domain-containing protein [Bacteroidota bacterium]